MSAVTTAPDPAGTATGAPFGDGAVAGNGTDAGAPPPFLDGIPISERAASLAQLYIGVTSAMLLLCIIAFTTRIYQRVRPVWKVGLDDYFIVAGFVSPPFPSSPCSLCPLSIHPH
jgi:hypothetical protein